MRRLLSLRRGVSGKLHLHRSCRKHRRQPHLRWRTLRESLQHRLFPLYLLRILRRSLPHRRNHPRPRLRASPLQHKLADLQKRKTTRKRHPKKLPSKNSTPASNVVSLISKAPKSRSEYRSKPRANRLKPITTSNRTHLRVHRPNNLRIPSVQHQHSRIPPTKRSQVIVSYDELSGKDLLRNDGSSLVSASLRGLPGDQCR